MTNDKRPVERIDRIFVGVMGFILATLPCMIVSAILGLTPPQVMPFLFLIGVTVGWFASRHVNEIDDWLKEKS